MIRSLFITAILVSLTNLGGQAWAAEHTVTWGYTPPLEPAVVGFRLWRGADPYTLVAEFPGWARGGRWTQETPIAVGEAFTLTAVFAGPVSTWIDARCADPQYTDEQTCTATNAGNTWTPAACSDPSYTNDVDCLTAGQTWTAAHCSDPYYTEETECLAATLIWLAAQCENTHFTTEAECEGTESPRSAVYVYPMGDGSSGVRHARFKTVAGVAAAPLTKQAGARLR